MFIYSVYDTVSEQSVFISMHHTTSEAERQFSSFMSNADLGNQRYDLDLCLLGSFDPHTLEIQTCDILTVCSGKDFIKEV